ILPCCLSLVLSIFYFPATATSDIYPLSLHDALPICHVLGLARGISHHQGGDRPVPDQRGPVLPHAGRPLRRAMGGLGDELPDHQDRKSTRLNSSHVSISYAVFCLKKKKKI